MTMWHISALKLSLSYLCFTIKRISDCMKSSYVWVLVLNQGKIPKQQQTHKECKKQWTLATSHTTNWQRQSEATRLKYTMKGRLTRHRWNQSAQGRKSLEGKEQGRGMGEWNMAHGERSLKRWEIRSINIILKHNTDHQRNKLKLCH